MTIALIILAALLAIALVLRERDHDRQVAKLLEAHEQERAANSVERSELLTRIQRPGLLPRRTGPVRAQVPADERKLPPELHMVGRVSPPRDSAADEAQEG